MIANRTGYLSPSSSTDSSSTRYSHLSVLTSSSSITSASAPSPLPSPSVSVHSIGSKTHAFFGSPFGGSPTPLPPLNPNRRSTSIKSQASIDSIVSQASASSEYEDNPGADETPRIEQRAPKRSLNADFFGPSLLPTPPPTAAHFPASPTDSCESSSSPPKRSHLPPIPLSRLFPSRRRYGTEDDSGDDSTGHRREFREFDPTPRSYPGIPTYVDAYSASPTVENGSAPPHVPEPSDLPTPLSGAADLEHSSNVSTAIEPKPKPPPPPPPIPPTDSQSQSSRLEAGAVLNSTSLSLRLERVLGHGAFSSVWLARDVQGQLGALELSRKTSLLRSRSEKRGRRLEGTRPKFGAVSGKGGVPMRRENRVVVRGHGQEQSDESIYLSEDGSGVLATRAVTTVSGRLVAVKMTDREMCESNSRSRVSFVREVEILRHISHPSIVSYVHSFSTVSHHCLVLEYVGGGELFDVIDHAESHSSLDEALLRRIFGELCKAVGWMHGVGLVHRDIKLENILLTTSLFSSPLPSLPASLIKLTDFGLSRFIDPAQPLLTTLCGSESYAAPELVTGRPYDGRETDAWACGVVLYTLATRRLPFDRQRAQTASREHEEATTVQSPAKHRADIRAERKALLVRIAKAEYAWPEDSTDSSGAGARRLTGTALANSAGMRRVVEKLLVRDPRKRSKIIDLWEDEWMRGEGAPIAPTLPASDENFPPHPGACDGEPGGQVSGECHHVDAVADIDLDAEDDDDGLIVDGEDIGPDSVAHQEH